MRYYGVSTFTDRNVSLDARGNPGGGMLLLHPNFSNSRELELSNTFRTSQ